MIKLLPSPPARSSRPPPARSSRPPPAAIGGTPGSKPAVIRLTMAALITLVVLLAGCGVDGEPPSGNGGGDPGGPRVADARFDGDFLIPYLTVDGRSVTLDTVPSMNLETVFGGLTVKPGCNTYFGSFTLQESGAASFTVAGGSNQDCGGLDAQEKAVLDALAAVTGWVEVSDGFRFDGPAGTSITMVR